MYLVIIFDPAFSWIWCKDTYQIFFFQFLNEGVERKRVINQNFKDVSQVEIINERRKDEMHFLFSEYEIIQQLNI